MWSISGDLFCWVLRDFYWTNFYQIRWKTWHVKDSTKKKQKVPILLIKKIFKSQQKKVTCHWPQPSFNVRFPGYESLHTISRVIIYHDIHCDSLRIFKNLSAKLKENWIFAVYLRTYSSEFFFKWTLNVKPLKKKVERSLKEAKKKLQFDFFGKRRLKEGN